MVKDQVIHEFLGALSSKSPIPGGGGTSALSGALGTALGQMVVNLTLGKKRYIEVEPQMKEILGKLKSLQEEFLLLADRDEEVFAPLAAAYSLPSVTQEEKDYKERVMEENLLRASLVPLDVMEWSVQALDLMEELAHKGSRMAVSDVGVGVQFIRTALTGAVMNVWINTKSMKNREKAGQLNGHAKELLDKGTAKADRIYGAVVEALR